jgi:two-component system response regulator
VAPILLIEDKPDDVELVRRVLAASRLPHELVVVGDGGEALDYLFALGAWSHRDVREQPALVLLDIDLPTVPGFEVMRQIRDDSATRLLRVVMLTQSRAQADLLESYGAGASGYIVKPHDLPSFADALRNLLDYWLRRNEPLAVPA